MFLEIQAVKSDIINFVVIFFSVHFQLIFQTDQGYFIKKHLEMLFSLFEQFSIVVTQENKVFTLKRIPWPLTFFFLNPS